MEQKNKNSFHTIVVGVDFSKYSKIVARQASQLSRQLNARLVLVNAQPLYNPNNISYAQYIPPARPADIKKQMAKFYKINSSANTFFEVKIGSPEDVLLSIAHKYPSPMIVVGSQGGNAVSRFILGSHAEAIALKSKYPVWVHRGHKIVPLKKVLIPTDLSNKSYRFMDKMKKWSDDLNLSTKYLFVQPSAIPTFNFSEYKAYSESVQKSIKKSLEQLRKRKPDIPLITRIGEASDRISKASHDFDVIAMNPHSRSGVLKKFGRVTSKVIRVSNHPVLVVKT